MRSRAGDTRLCDVDLLAHKSGGRTVIIEVEESNVKPVQVFGKFFASAHATHHGEDRIDERPLLFIQVLDTSTLKIDKTGKIEQWKVLEALIKQHAKRWPRQAERRVKYELLVGGPDDFRRESGPGTRLVKTVQGFLGVRGEPRRQP